MINLEFATTLVTDWLDAQADAAQADAAFADATQTGGQRGELGVYEYDRGFVFWQENPLQADPTRPPASVGGGCIVVDRETGELSFWPPLPAVLIALRYGQS